MRSLPSLRLTDGHATRHSRAKLVSLPPSRRSYAGGKMVYENLIWFCRLWISVLVARRLWRAIRLPASAVVSSPRRKAPRPLKPRSPHDCSMCGRPHPTPLMGNVRRPGVLPWRERKSLRGRRKTICTAGYACPNPECDYCGNTDSTFHTLVGHGQCGVDGIQELKCQACCKRFSRSNGSCTWATWRSSPYASRRWDCLARSTRPLSNDSTLRLCSGQVLLCVTPWRLYRRRRSWATAQLSGELRIQLESWRACYHFCRPHLSLRLTLEMPQLRRGKQTPRRTKRALRTPATLAPALRLVHGRLCCTPACVPSAWARPCK
jgi:hypothetical protein